MSYAIVFSSQTGNTKLLAEALKNSLPQEECLYIGTPDPKALNADTLYVGFWTDKGNADAASLSFLKLLQDKNAVYWSQTCISQWKTLGWSSIIYIAAITGIDSEKRTEISGTQQQNHRHLYVSG